MRTGSFESIMIWGFLFIVFGPLAAATLTTSVDTVLAELLPYAATAGAIMLGVLAIRMFFRR